MIFNRINNSVAEYKYKNYPIMLKLINSDS